MQLALSTTIAPPPIPVWDELSGNLRQGFTTKKQGWNPGPNVVNSTTQIGLRASLFLEGFRQSHSARYYNPITGRFTSRDPNDGNPSDPATLHKYLYADGDPIDLQDPTGRAGTGTRTAGGGAALEYPGVIVFVSLQTIPAVRTFESALLCELSRETTKFTAEVLNGLLYSNSGEVTPSGECSNKLEHDCTKYEGPIQAALEEVQWRYSEMLRDKGYLYEYYCKHPDNPWINGTSWPSHQYEYEGAQAELRAAILAARNARCPVSKEAETWAELPPPNANARCGGE